MDKLSKIGFYWRKIERNIAREGSERGGHTPCLSAPNVCKKIVQSTYIRLGVAIERFDHHVIFLTKDCVTFRFTFDLCHGDQKRYRKLKLKGNLFSISMSYIE